MTRRTTMTQTYSSVWVNSDTWPDTPRRPPRGSWQPVEGARAPSLHHNSWRAACQHATPSHTRVHMGNTQAHAHTGTTLMPPPPPRWQQLPAPFLRAFWLLLLPAPVWGRRMGGVKQEDEKIVLRHERQHRNNRPTPLFSSSTSSSSLSSSFHSSTCCYLRTPIQLTGILFSTIPLQHKWSIKITSARQSLRNTINPRYSTLQNTRHMTSTQ